MSISGRCWRRLSRSRGVPDGVAALSLGRWWISRVDDLHALGRIGKPILAAWNAEEDPAGPARPGPHPTPRPNRHRRSLVSPLRPLRRWPGRPPNRGWTPNGPAWTPASSPPRPHSPQWPPAARTPLQGIATDLDAIGAPRGPQRPAESALAITPPPTIAVDDAGAGHAALLAAHAARNEANAVRRAELVERARAIAERASRSEPRPAAATVVRAPLRDRLAGLLAKHAGDSS